ncbi:ROK family protein [Paenarthrobacter sp. PH39-S1]|uniref:ROK family protein n=1 Tax=Paenarthrobacter sp. PH39-S1 TaxID=3046204 RepID=UPI0024BA1D1D|nr:ROK family protein [Paenarthrobacter sp. PH39-S1]MDJ0356398.1 ROK family protein [Paenarthrobacter sp. PH39-S1]
MNTAYPGAASAVAVGVDLGGTGSRFVVLDDSRRVLAHVTVPTPIRTSPADAVSFIEDHVNSVADGATVRSIGIGASGPVDATGVIRNQDTLPAFMGLDLVAGLTKAYSIPVSIDNDAVTAAICEASIGAARDYPSLLMITLGTGVGVSALVHGEPVRGADGVHPEAGHLSVAGGSTPCYCGRASCWEQVASRTALQKAAGRLLSQPSGGPADIQIASDRSVAGDEPARELFNAYGRRIADGLADLLTVYRSAAVVLGGSGASYYRAYGHSLEARLGELKTYASVPPIFISQAGDLGGAIGAALLGLRRASPIAYQE